MLRALSKLIPNLHLALSSTVNTEALKNKLLEPSFFEHSELNLCGRKLSNSALTEFLDQFSANYYTCCVFEASENELTSVPVNLNEISEFKIFIFGS